MFFFLLFIAVQEDFHTTEFPSAVFSAAVCLKEEKKKHSLAVFELSAQSLPFRIVDGFAKNLNILNFPLDKNNCKKQHN